MAVVYVTESALWSLHHDSRPHGQTVQHQTPEDPKYWLALLHKFKLCHIQTNISDYKCIIVNICQECQKNSNTGSTASPNASKDNKPLTGRRDHRKGSYVCILLWSRLWAHTWSHAEKPSSFHGEWGVKIPQNKNQFWTLMSSFFINKSKFETMKENCACLF